MSFREQRINSEMQKSLSDIINNRLKDPRIIGMVTVLEVNCAKDLKTAKVTVSVYGDDGESTVTALKNCSGYIRKELSVDFKDIRTIPQLTFVLDKSAEHGRRIDELIAKVNNKDNQ